MRVTDDDLSGCGTILALVLVIGAIVAAVMSIAAFVDPFSWLPTVSEMFSDCEEEFGTNECDLAARFPGFWPHVIVNFVYALVTAGLLWWTGRSVAKLRVARYERFDGAGAAERYANARGSLAAATFFVAVLALLPILAALI